jgi:hypothetical protein
MMTYKFRRTLAVALAVTLGALVATYEPHRHFLAVVWPIFTELLGR